MKYKEIINNKLDRLESLITEVKFHTQRGNPADSTETFQKIIELVETIRHYIKSEA